MTDLESRQRVFERESTKWCSGSSVVAEIGETHGSEARGEWEEKEWAFDDDVQRKFLSINVQCIGDCAEAIMPCILGTIVENPIGIFGGRWPTCV